jgi:hypothetical protein
MISFPPVPEISGPVGTRTFRRGPNSDAPSPGPNCGKLDQRGSFSTVPFRTEATSVRARPGGRFTHRGCGRRSAIQSPAFPLAREQKIPLSARCPKVNPQNACQDRMYHLGPFPRWWPGHRKRPPDSGTSFQVCLRQTDSPKSHH